MQKALRTIYFSAPARPNATKLSSGLAKCQIHAWYAREQNNRTQVMIIHRNKAREMFKFGFHGYMQHAFPLDELDPINCKGITRDDNVNNTGINDVLGNFSLTLVDSLDTLAIMGYQSEFERAVKTTIETVHFDLDSRVQVFEVTIRMLGGLLSAHIFASDDKYGTKIKGYNGELLLMAHDLGKRLLPAFDTPFGLPFPRINLRNGVLKEEIREACTAGAGTLILEFGTLSRLTGNPLFEQVAKKAMREIWSRRSPLGLLGNTMKIFSKEWADGVSGVGAGMDSFFEYLFKAYVLFGETEYLNYYKQADSTMKIWIRDDSGFFYKNVGMNSGQLAVPWIDSLAAFYPGLQVLAGDVTAAIRPHFFYFSIWEKFDALPERFNLNSNWLPIEIYPLRPELIESTYMLFQATRNNFYLEVGERILTDLERYAKTRCGYAALKSVVTKEKDARMESFFLSETLKYLYLLFDIGTPL